MTQREGRILRQGNTNGQVYIYRYITKGSFDAYSWQLLETKQRFIYELLSGSVSERSGSDIESTVLDYGEVKALAVENPLVKERIEAHNELTRYLALQRKTAESKTRLEKELLELPSRIKNQEINIGKCKADLLFYTEWKKSNSADGNNIIRNDETENRKELIAYIDESVKNYILETKEKILTVYREFNIILPANMTKAKPYVWLSRQGKYYVELGDNRGGNLILIDNFLENLESYLKELEFTLDRLKERESDIKTALSKKESYIDRIKFYQNKVKALDMILGVEIQ